MFSFRLFGHEYLDNNLFFFCITNIVYCKLLLQKLKVFCFKSCLKVKKMKNLAFYGRKIIIFSKNFLETVLFYLPQYICLYSVY